MYKKWLPDQPFDAIVFDCDSTLSRLEGIDHLARQNGVGEAVHVMTERAMNDEGVSFEMYKQRLELVKPSRTQMVALGHSYYEHTVADVKTVLAIFQQLGKEIFITSAGNNPSVSEFARHLSIPTENVFAVDVYFDAAGNYAGYEEDTPLSSADGKIKYVHQIQQRCPRVMYVGDGMNDIPLYDQVSRFVGYGGVVYRENMAKICELYLRNESLLPLLPLSLTPLEQDTLTLEQRAYFQEGAEMLLEVISSS